MAKKKKAKALEPEFYMSPTNIPTRNYKVYYMKPLEKLLYSVLAFVVGAVVGLLFYGGIGKDQYGNPTTITHVLNVVIPAVVGLVAAKLFIPVRTKQIIDARRKKLNTQFRDMLEGVTTALGAGSNILGAFTAVYDDLKLQYSEDAYIINELEVILSGVQNGNQIEDLLMDFGVRSGINSIESFAAVFQVSYRKGGNIREAMTGTYETISQKMEIMDEIETSVAASKTDSSIMTIMPIAIVGVIKVMSPGFAENFVSGIGIISTTIAVACFVGAYFISRKMLNIKI